MPVMPACVGFCVACAEIGQASSPVTGSMVPARLFDRGWLNMSYVSCPVTSPSPPYVSHRTRLKPPRPGSMGATVPFPPPPSCSPLSGKSSSNTITESLPVGSGVGSTSTLTVWVKAELAEHALGPPSMLQAGGTGAPLMVWPHVPVVEVPPVLEQTGCPTYAGNGLPASPGSTEM